MKDLPIVAKAVINIVLYIVYWIMFCIIIWIIMYTIKGNISNELADKIGLFWAILVLLVSLILRKYFYICGQREEKEVLITESYTAKKKPLTKKKTTKTVKQVEVENDEDEIKIYVEKEIK